MTDSSGFTHATFESLVGEAFRVRSPEGEDVVFELADARDLSSKMQLPDGFRPPYSLMFRPRTDIRWPQGTFSFDHDTLGAWTMFCSAIVDPTRPGLPAYEATFA